LQDGFGTLGRPDLATLALAVIRGLIMDLDAMAEPNAPTGPSPTS
jgi:hypothetical protein